MKSIWANSQWAVTKGGLRCIERPWTFYDVAKRELADRAHLDPEVSKWVIHFSQKTWVDGELFVEAFRRALEIHAVENPPDMQLTEAVARQWPNFGRKPVRKRRKGEVAAYIATDLNGDRTEFSYTGSGKLVCTRLSRVSMVPTGYDVAAAKLALGRQS